MEKGGAEWPPGPKLGLSWPFSSLRPFARLGYPPAPPSATSPVGPQTPTPSPSHLHPRLSFAHLPLPFAPGSLLPSARTPPSAPHTCLDLGLFAHSPPDNLTISQFIRKCKPPDMELIASFLPSALNAGSVSKGAAHTPKGGGRERSSTRGRLPLRVKSQVPVRSGESGQVRTLRSIALTCVLPRLRRRKARAEAACSKGRAESREPGSLGQACKGPTGEQAALPRATGVQSRARAPTRRAGQGSRFPPDPGRCASRSLGPFGGARRRGPGSPSLCAAVCSWEQSWRGAGALSSGGSW